MMLLNSTAISDLQDLLDTQGLHAGLAFLNARVPHRFTAIYQLSAGYLRRLDFIDKEGGLGESTATVPFKNSFCEIAVSQGHLLVTDSSADARLRDQPNPFMIGSYVGLPLATTGSGALYGTLCHYDTCAHLLGDAELMFLQQASELLTQFCLRVGMPLHLPTTV